MTLLGGMLECIVSFPVQSTRLHIFPVWRLTSPWYIHFKAQLPAHHKSINWTPVMMTHSSPHSSNAHLHPPLPLVWSVNKTNITTVTRLLGSCRDNRKLLIYAGTLLILVAIPLALTLHTLPAGTLKLKKRMTTIGITIICTCIGEPIGCNFNTQSKIVLLGYRQQSRYKLYTSHKVVSSACYQSVPALMYCSNSVY